MTKDPNTQKRSETSSFKHGVSSSLGISCFVIPPLPGASSFERPLAFISPGGGEFLLIMLVLILLFGAKDAPRIFRSLYSAMNKLQRAAASFRYKIMYGDLNPGAVSEAPYDTEAAETGDDLAACEAGDLTSEDDLSCEAVAKQEAPSATQGDPTPTTRHPAPKHEKPV